MKHQSQLGETGWNKTAKIQNSGFFTVDMGHSTCSLFFLRIFLDLSTNKIDKDFGRVTQLWQQRLLLTSWKKLWLPLVSLLTCLSLFGSFTRRLQKSLEHSIQMIIHCRILTDPDERKTGAEGKMLMYEWIETMPFNSCKSSRRGWQPQISICIRKRTRNYSTGEKNKFASVEFFIMSVVYGSKSNKRMGVKKKTSDDSLAKIQ